MTRVKSLLLILFVAATPAIAQTQSEMNEEAAADFAKADRKLNAVYTEVKASLDDDGIAKLKAAQRAWIAYRDAEADFQTDHEARGGSIAPLVHETCREQLTRERIGVLKKLLEAPNQ